MVTGQWIDILVTLLGVIGGTGGIISIYHAKSKKDTIDIQNFHALIEEERKERTILAEEHRAYKEEVNRKVAQVKQDFEKLREENQLMLRAIYQAYRCRFPEDVEDCPVLSLFSRKNCDKCKEKINGDETD